MFKIESYITPLIMGYVDKYVKLRPEDFQLSLWGGDAVIYNLDLRLDVLEKAMQLPIVFQSGHIHELRLHVPWSKIWSEPVVITINTIECILKLRDTAYTNRKKPKDETRLSRVKSSSALKAKVKRQDTEDLPPGYLQSLMNKIMNNVSIIVNNLIVKFVEDDIVLSLNVRSAECYSVDKEWNRSFVELSPPDFVLHKVINFCDLTVCLDKRDASGRIQNYQDPIAYRCSLLSRLYLQYDGIKAKIPSEIKLNFYCERLDLSLTDTQLPMVIRLIEMCMALYNGTMDFHNVDDTEADDSRTSEGSRGDGQQDDPHKEESVGELPPSMKEMQDQGWAQWAWSYVPQILPEDEEDGESVLEERRKLKPVVFSLGMYAYKLTVNFKLTERIREKIHYGPRKVVFKPFVYLEAEGIGLDILVQGLGFFDCQMGITNLRVFSQGCCICGTDGEEGTRNHMLMSGGDLLTNKTTSNYMTQSLFDPQGSENLGIPTEKILDWDDHLQVYTEQYGLQKYGVFWMDYLFTMAIPVETPAHSSKSSVSDSHVDEPVFIRENSLMRFLVGQCHLNFSSTTVHRVHKLISCAKVYEYEPYAKPQRELVDQDRPYPTEEQVQSMEDFIPTRTSHLTLFQPIISFLSAEHAYCDVAKKTYKSKTKAESSLGLAPGSTSVHPLYGIQLSTNRFDLQVTSAMYPRKLVRLVSKIAGPPSNMLHHCHSHTQIKLFGFHAGLMKVEVDGSRSPLLTIIPPMSGAMYTRRLLLPMYWKDNCLPKVEHVYEFPQVSASITKPALFVVMEIVSSWYQTTPKPSDIKNTSLLMDVFPSKEEKKDQQFPMLEMTMSGFEMKTCRTALVTACTGTVSSVQAFIYTYDDCSKVKVTPILYGPSNTESLHLPDWLKEDSSPVMEDKNDCLSFTYQLPCSQNYTEAPALVLVNMEGISCCLDPTLSDWLSYLPRQMAPPSRGKKVEVDLELAKAASPLQANISQVSQPSSSSNQHHSETLTYTKSPIPDHPSLGSPNEGEGEAGGVGKEENRLGTKLAKIFPLIRVIQVQVEVKKICCFLFKSHLHLSDPSSNVPNDLQGLSRSRSLADMVVVSFPHVVIQSSGLKPVSFLQEIPVRQMEGSLVGDKLPWNVSLRNFSVYTVHEGQSDLPLKTLQLVHPATVSCTVAVTFKCTPPTSDNISALGLCLHTDMHAVIASASLNQVTLLMAVTKRLLLLGNTVSKVIAEVKQKLRDNSVNAANVKPSTTLNMSSVASPQKSTQYESSVYEPDGIYTCTETSCDLTSLDTTPSKELEIIEMGGEGVRLSLWLQWTLPKCELQLISAGQNACKISLVLEENTISVDVQDVYAKVKVKVGSINLSHFTQTGSGVWEKGMYEGILMSCQGDLSHDTTILSVKPWSGGDHKHQSHPNIQTHSREVSHGFLNLTFTRALRKNVKSRFQKMNIDVGSDQGSREKQFYFHKYVSEICVGVAQCDFVLYAPAIQGILGELADFGSTNITQGAPQKGVARKPSVRASHPQPWFTSSNLPLIYADLAGVRLFIPGKTSHVTDGPLKLKTTLDHDLLVVKVQSINMIPQADNPLPRYPVQKELYQRAVQTGVTKQPGSAMLDRQYEVDVKGFSVSSGCWLDFVEKEKSMEMSGTGIQFPAVEWNGLSSFQKEQDEIVLFPLISDFDIKMVAAPAIVNVYPNLVGMATQKSLICGYSMEVNITSNLDLHVSVHQVRLIKDICTETIRSLTRSSSVTRDPTEDVSQEFEPLKSTNGKGRDSGLGSDLSAKTFEKRVPVSLPGRQTSSQSLVTGLTPVDVLLTVGRISCTLYTHKVLESDVVFKPERERRTSLNKKVTKTDLEWKVDPEIGSDDEAVYDDGKTSYDLASLGLMNIQQDTQGLGKTIERGSVCIVPYFYLYISQPHTVLSCSPTSQKFEMSCYDILVKGPTPNSLVQVSESKMLSDYTDYSVYWLETRAGQPDPVTGIPPCLYTLTLTDFLIKPVGIKLMLERPVKLSLSFVKFNQVRGFVDTILDVCVDMATIPKHTERKHPQQHQQQQQQTKSPGILSKIKCLEFQTDQIVVAMDTIPCDQAPGVVASFSSLRVDAEISQSDKGDVNSIQASAFVRDFLLKTKYYRSTAMLFGPAAVKMDAEMSSCFHSNEQSPPQIIVTIATGLVVVNVSQEQVLCLQLVLNHLTDLIKSMKKVKVTEKDVAMPTDRDQTPPINLSTVKDFVVQTSVDDLRSGLYQYIMNLEDTGESAKPGEIVFCDKGRDGNSTMTWSFHQPRVISHIQLTPIPFNVEENEEIQVTCILQYWEPLIQQFVDYVEMEISEREVTEAALPDVNSGNSRELVVSQIWRVMIKQVDGRCIVQPSSLAVSMRVDSCSVPSLIPTLQAGLTMESLELRCSNHLHCLSQGIPTKLKPFFMDSCVPASQEFAVVKFDNVLVAGTHLAGNQARTQTQFSSQLSVDVLEYRTLTMQRVVSPFEVAGSICLQPNVKPPLVDLDMTCDPLTLRIGRGVVHTLNCSAQAWSQLTPTPTAGNRDDLVLFGHYTLCNDTQFPMRFGQVGTDENLVLQPREMHLYSWRSQQTKQALHLCMDGKTWKWCDPFDINKAGTVVRSVKSTDQQYTLIVRTSQISNVQNQVIISGQLLISNRLTLNIEVKVITTAGNIEQHRAIIGAEQAVPSYIVEPSSVQCVRFRPWGTKSPWSKEVNVWGQNMKESCRIKFVMPDQSAIHVWCRIFVEKFKTVSQILVTLCPMFVVRSHLPVPLYINLDTPKLKQHNRVESPGRGEDIQLQCLGGEVHHSVTFQFSPKSDESSTAVTLSSGLIDQLQDRSAKLPDLQTLYTNWKTDHCWDWPYCIDKLDRSMFDLSNPSWKQNLATHDYPSQSTIDLSVSLSELWHGCGTVLVDVAPWCLFSNNSSLDLVVVTTKENVMQVPKGQTVCPPRFEASFQLCVRLSEDVYSSCHNIPVSDEEVSLQRYRSDIGSTLYLDSFVHTVMVTGTADNRKVCLLTVQSAVRHQMRVISVRERLYLSNLTSGDLSVNLFTVPQWSDKVSLPLVEGQTVPSHARCDRNHSNVYPVAWLPINTTDENSELESNTIFIHYMSIKHASGEKLNDDSSQSKSETQTMKADWSFPVRLTASESGIRVTCCVQTYVDDETRCKPLCVSGHVKSGISYFVVREDKAPQCLIRNRCPFTLVFGQMLMNLSLSGTAVQEETELVTCLPTVPPGGEEVYYTSPYMNTIFPEITDQSVMPKLMFAADRSHNKADEKDVSKFSYKWSSGIDLRNSADTFLSIPGLADTKVHIEHIAMVTYITVEPISKAEISAKEIRSRLKGKETTISIESKETEKNVLEEKLSEKLKAEIEMPTQNEKLQIAKSKIKSSGLKYQCQVGVLLSQLSVVLQDELSSPESAGELMRLTADNVFGACYPASAVPEVTDLCRTCFTLSVEDFQLDNQAYSLGTYDFPVVVVRQDFQTKKEEDPYLHLEDMNVFEKHAVLKAKSILHLQVVMATTPRISTVIETLELSSKPLSLYIDDSFVFRVIKELESYIPSQLSFPPPVPILIMVLKLPSSVKSCSQVVSSPAMFKHLCIQPCSVLLSVHASMKLFIALDHTPLSFKKFERFQLTTTSHQLIRALAMHYASGALFRAGTVVGSLEILGNPTGLVRSIGLGVADFFRMPYRGLTRGPGAFVVGVSGGTASLLKNISTGMLTSITNFASSVSRNMDRLSMDNSHQERQEQTRRHRPDGVSNGLRQGLTGLGISLLGAVAGLADQPIQNLVSQQAEPGTRSTASSLMSGMGKGLVGVFTKPIGGAAEFVSQTGQGLLHGSGLSRLPEPRLPMSNTASVSTAHSGQVKFAMKLLQSLPSNDILITMDATYIDPAEPLTPVTLVLTSEILFIINQEEDSQQQAFSVAELDCGIRSGVDSVLTLTWRDTVAFREEQPGPTCEERIAAFIHGAVSYAVPREATLLQQQTLNQEAPKVDSSSDLEEDTPEQEPEIDSSIPDNQLFQNPLLIQGREFIPTVLEGAQLSDCKSDSSSSAIDSASIAAPEYNFQMSSTNMAAFMAMFVLTKRRLQGIGFAM